MASKRPPPAENAMITVRWLFEQSSRAKETTSDTRVGSSEHLLSFDRFLSPSLLIYFPHR